MADRPRRSRLTRDKDDAEDRAGISKSEIMAELPRLRAEDRQEILERLWQMDEATLLHGGAPDPAETALLDRELIAFEHDTQNGSPWREVLSRVRTAASR